MLQRLKLDILGKILIIADRGYESYNMLAHLLEKKVDFLIRVKQGANCMREVKNLINEARGEIEIAREKAKLAGVDFVEDESFDKIVRVTVTTNQTNIDKENGHLFIQTGSKKGKKNSPKTAVSRWDFRSPYTLVFRVVHFKLDSGEYETIVTSLDQEVFPSEKIKKLYNMRWGIETSFRELKYAIGLVNLHSKKDESIQQEIFAGLTMYNFCERITGAVVVEQNASNKHAYQVNYTMAFHIAREFFARTNKFGFSVFDEIRKYILPIRPGRRRKSNCAVRPKQVISFIYRVAA